MIHTTAETERIATWYVKMILADKRTAPLLLSLLDVLINRGRKLDDLQRFMEDYQGSDTLRQTMRRLSLEPTDPLQAAINRIAE